MSKSGSVFLRLAGRFFSVGHSNNEAGQFFKLLEKYNVKETEGAEQPGGSPQRFGALESGAKLAPVVVN